MNFNVNFNVLLSKYIVHPLVKIKDFENKFIFLAKKELCQTVISVISIIYEAQWSVFYEDKNQV